MRIKLQSKFQDILRTGIRKRLMPNKTQEAKDWYRAKAVEAFSSTRINRRNFIKEGNTDDSIRKRVTPGSVVPGEMLFYNYDPKWKATLPVYDTFPLVFPFTVLDDRFYGINLHFIPLDKRAQLMDLLYSIAEDKKFNRNTKLALSYKALKDIADSDLYGEAIRCYLKKHVKSQIKKIEPIEWDIVAFMPLARYVIKDPRYNFLRTGY